MRALFRVLVSFVFLAPFAYGNSLQPGPPGSTPSDNSVILTFASSADMRSSYLVDRRGFYELNAVQVTNNIGVGLRMVDDGAGTKGSSPASVGLDTLNSKSANAGPGSYSANAGSFFLGSRTGGNSGFSGLSVGSRMFAANGTGSELSAGSKGLNLFAALSNSETTGLGSERLRDGPGPSVNATPLPGSWTMMLVGLLALGVRACFRKLRTSATRPATIELATE